MRSLDVHTHVLPKELPRWAPVRLEQAGGCTGKLLRQDGTLFREVQSNCWDAAVRLQECDAAGVGVQVLSPVPVLFAYQLDAQRGADLARALNDHIASLCAAHPRRFIGLGTLPMQAPELAARELERCVRQLGLAGAEIGTHVNDWNLSDATLFPVFARAQELDAALFVHPWDMMGEARMRKYWLPWLVGMPAEVSLAICSLIFGGVLERLPRLRVLFAHGGGAFPVTLGRIEHGFLARPDLVAVDNPHPPSRYLQRIYVDALVHDARALRFVLDLFGPERVALGTDYPFPLGEAKPGALIDSLGLPPAAREQLRSGTALAWLGRQAGAYDL